MRKEQVLNHVSNQLNLSPEKKVCPAMCILNCKGHVYSKCLIIKGVQLKQKFKVRINQVFNLLTAISFSTIPDLSLLFIPGIQILKLSRKNALTNICLKLTFYLVYRFTRYILYIYSICTMYIYIHNYLKPSVRKRWLQIADSIIVQVSPLYPHPIHSGSQRAWLFCLFVLNLSGLERPGKCLL